jgi:hypothetical protein
MIILITYAEFNYGFVRFKTAFLLPSHLFKILTNLSSCLPVAEMPVHFHAVKAQELIM